MISHSLLGEIIYPEREHSIPSAACVMHTPLRWHTAKKKFQLSAGQYGEGVGPEMTSLV
jgi:hypothetical protein